MMANHEMIELDYDPLEFLDGEGLATMVSSEGGAAAAEVAAAEEQMSATLELHEALAGCFSIVGPIAICYTKVGAGFKVCLKLAGIEAVCANIGLNKCQTLQANILLAKASIKVCLQGSCLKYEAKACYRTTPFSSWKCVSKSGTIICV
ncbi:hypothetical protein [Microcoleus sp. CAWBG58]|uniref:hypothetical protein n=1 Tax=Microcoleus sp. CAWBG58 TaxID=2841651 RepID=UPI0025F7C2B6|nr:hypothetical protein [Microcoleus sp. CAWBG58]